MIIKWIAPSELSFLMVITKFFLHFLLLYFSEPLVDVFVCEHKRLQGQKKLFNFYPFGNFNNLCQIEISSDLKR